MITPVELARCFGKSVRFWSPAAGITSVALMRSPDLSPLILSSTFLPAFTWLGVAVAEAPPDPRAIGAIARAPSTVRTAKNLLVIRMRVLLDLRPTYQRGDASATGLTIGPITGDIPPIAAGRTYDRNQLTRATSISGTILVVVPSAGSEQLL